MFLGEVVDDKVVASGQLCFLIFPIIRRSSDNRKNEFLMNS